MAGVVLSTVNSNSGISQLPEEIILKGILPCFAVNTVEGFFLVNKKILGLAISSVNDREFDNVEAISRVFREKGNGYDTWAPAKIPSPSSYPEIEKHYSPYKVLFCIEFIKTTDGDLQDNRVDFRYTAKLIELSKEKITDVKMRDQFYIKMVNSLSFCQAQEIACKLILDRPDIFTDNPHHLNALVLDLMKEQPAQALEIAKIITGRTQFLALHHFCIEQAKLGREVFFAQSVDLLVSLNSDEVRGTVGMLTKKKFLDAATILANRLPDNAELLEEISSKRSKQKLA